MTNGYVNIKLGDTEINALFSKGRITAGAYQISDTGYDGTFDQNSKLHGAGCLTYRNHKYVGNFEHGSFTHGHEYIDEKLVADGTFEHTPGSLPIIVNGKRYSQQFTEEGNFRQHYLSNGTITRADGTILSGDFVHGILKDGILENKVLGFKAIYSVKRNYTLNRDVLHSCQVEFNGDPMTLPKEMLMLYACRGDNCTSIHLMYMDMELMQGTGLKYLLERVDYIRKKIDAFQLPVYDEMVANLTTPATIDKNPTFMPSVGDMFGTYYNSHA